MRVDIYKDGIGYVTDEVSEIPTYLANASEGNRQKFVTDLAAVSRGKSSSNNPALRYKKLLKEAAPKFKGLDGYKIAMECINDKVSMGKSPSRPLEFLPIIVHIFLDAGAVTMWKTNYSDSDDPIFEFKDLAEFNNSLGNHSYLEKIPDEDNLYRCYTNMRAMLNAGVPYDSVPYARESDLPFYKEFKALKARVPMFAFNHLITHTALSKEAQSDRVTKDGEYWLPSDLRKRAYEYNDVEDTSYREVYTEWTEVSASILSFEDRNKLVSKLLSLSQNVVQAYLKALGYEQEIYQRAMLEFRYKEVVMTGWYNNPKTFRHFMIEREAYPTLHESWVQNETRLLANGVREVLEVSF